MHSFILLLLLFAAKIIVEQRSGIWRRKKMLYNKKMWLGRGVCVCVCVIVCVIKGAAQALTPTAKNYSNESSEDDQPKLHHHRTLIQCNGMLRGHQTFCVSDV